MSGVPNPRRAHHPEAAHAVITAEDLHALADFQDEAGHAISFYFKPAKGRNTARDAMIVRLGARDIISDAFASGGQKNGLLRDLDEILEISENASELEGPMKVVFACHERGIWLEFDVPAPTRHVRLQVGKAFNVLPLLRTLKPSSQEMQ